MHNVPPVSVIIPTFESARTMEACLRSVRSQNYGNFEIVVVDNGSKDSTRDIAREYADAVFTAGPERTAQKNYGILKSRGEYVCFVDSDMVLTENVLAECAEILSSDPSVGGVRIPETSEGEGFFVKIRDFERSFYAGTDVESARFFRKSDVVAVWGFEEDLVFFEESLLPQKIEKSLGLSCKASVSAPIRHQEGAVRLSKWLKKKYYYGKSLGKYRKKVAELGIVQTGEWQFWILRRYSVFLGNRRFYSKPVLALGVLALKTAEFASGGLGLLLGNER